MNTLDNYQINLLRARARRRGIDFGKNRSAATDTNHGGFRVWRIVDGQTLLGDLFDATDLDVKNFIDAEIDRLDGLSRRYRAPRRRIARDAA